MYEVFVNQNLNMDTVLLMEPMALSIAKIIDIDPTPIIMGQIFASNIGGTMTMIGDPPNIMIGSAANLSFLDFLENTGLPCVIALAIVIFVMKILYKKKPEAEGNKVKFIINLDEDKAVVNLTLMKQSIFMIILIVAAFTAHGVIGLEPSVIALTAAVVMMIIGKQDIDEIISDAEWSTLMFFFGLFIVVGVLSKQVSLNNCHYL